MLGEPRLGEVADLGCFTIRLFRTLLLGQILTVPQAQLH